jgi:PTH1 family peptidyl-tRNA hydrolase
VGLGNPGEKYRNNRHNAGFLVLDKLAQMVNGQWSMNEKFVSLIINHQSSIIFSKPSTMMNDSGLAVLSLTTYYKIHTTDLWVIHDDLDIKLGQYKIQLGKGPKVHNGIKSVNEALGTSQYWRVRVGIENRNQIRNSKMENGKQMENDNWKMENNLSGENYVLSDFTKKELEVLEGVVDNVCEEITKILKVRG